ncbi:hypothetical protein [Gemmatimonas sp.]|jgi:hypothetical protein|uniref:hypothetical protein n=1 Tax=Gemmatimonas sp. TaxID=1962908 RepID=UPI0037BF89B1
MGKRLNHLLQGSSLSTWEAFAAEVQGTWSAPSLGHEARLVIPHAHGPIVLERDVTMIMAGNVMIPVVSTIFSAPRPTNPAHRFSVSRANFATSVAEWFGRLDIHVDDPVFDDAFVLKGDTPDFVRTLFRDAPLRERYRADFEGSIALKDDQAFSTDPTPGIDPLELTVSGLIEDASRLRRMYELFAATLTRLDEIGG